MVYDINVTFLSLDVAELIYDEKNVISKIGYASISHIPIKLLAMSGVTASFLNFVKFSCIIELLV